jgi:GDPmannose 4,6-dehydratase
MVKKALITGVTGQDGSHLADFLLEKGYEVHGLVRRSSTIESRARIEHLFNPNQNSEDLREIPFYRHYGNIECASRVEEIIREIMPDEIYNLAAQSHVGISFTNPDETFNVNEKGVRNILEAIRKFCPNSKFYQASSSEMFGSSPPPQNEKTPLNPLSPYAQSKVAAFQTTEFYRRVHKIFACNGILFNHEGERRGHNFVTRKITSSLSRIKIGTQKKLILGNLDAKRDWGYSPDYVKAMWLILQQEKPDDFVIGTGETHTIREFLEESAKYLDMKIKSNGASDINEKYLDENGNVIVEISPEFFRPSEVNSLLADFSKAEKILGWKPTVKFHELIKIMCDNDRELAKKELLSKKTNVNN